MQSERFWIALDNRCYVNNLITELQLTSQIKNQIFMKEQEYDSVISIIQNVNTGASLINQCLI